MDEQNLFALLIEAPADEQSRLLDQHCAAQPELRQRMERLLKLHGQDSPLDRPRIPSVTLGDANPGRAQIDNEGTDDFAPREFVGATIGAFVLEERLGEGGMGTVWVAKQKEPVKRRVALKLIKAGMDSREVLARFNHERQALAVMDHPNIAKVFDAGVTSEGRPFFAMELINGLPLAKYCDQARLDLQHRLRIFVQICSAVQHAHQKGIIHRDLKPANILITQIDGSPVPKVIDFGVSKALAADSLDQTTMTRFGAVIGTIEYMSPEQAGYSGTDVDTRADIYALGVILYELLTGLKPFDPARMRKAAIDEVIRIIREEEPNKPSTRLSSADARPSLAAVRGTEPLRLAKMIRGDLDWIALKCLEKDRNRRYETANQLAMEVKRYLADEPVMAGPPTARYLLVKFLRRNRRQMAVAATVFLALLVGLAASLWQMNRAIIAESAATIARDDEAKQRKTADALRIKAEENERKAIESGRRAQEALDTITDNAISSLFSQKAKLTKNERQFFQRLLSLYDGLWSFEGDDRESINRRMLGYWRVTQMQANLGAYDDAVQALDRMQKVFAELENPNDPMYGHGRVLALRNAANMSFNAGRKDDGKRFLDEGEAVVRKALVSHPDNNDLRECELTLAYDRLRIFPQKDLGSQAKALEGIVNQARSLIPVARDPGSPANLMLDCLGIQYDALFASNRDEEALACVNEVLNYLDRIPPDRPKLTKAYVLNKRGYTLWHRGNVLSRLGRDSEAIIDYEQGLAVMRERESAGLIRYHDWDILWNGSRMLRCGLANTYERQKRFLEAVEQRRLALADIDRWAEFTSDQKQVILVKAEVQNDLSRAILLGGGSREAAIDALIQCAEFREANLDQFENIDEYRESIAKYRDYAANLLGELGSLDKALDQRRKAIAVRSDYLRNAPQTPLSSQVRIALGWSYLDLGLGCFGKNDTALGVEEIERGIATLDQVLANDAESEDFKKQAFVAIAHGHHRIADQWWKLGEVAKARDAYKIAIESETKAHQANPDDFKTLELLATAWHTQGDCNLRLGDFTTAVKDFIVAIDLVKTANPDLRQATTLADQWINQLDVAADQQRLAGRPGDALPVYRDARTLRQYMLARSPDSVEFSLRMTWSHHNVCVGALELGRIDEALQAAHDLAEACIAFGKLHGDKFDETMNATDTAFKAGKQLLNAGHTAAAIELYRSRLAVRLELAERFPENPVCLDALMYAHFDMYLAHWVEGNRDLALASLRRSIDAAIARKAKFSGLKESHAKYDQCVNSICSTLREHKEYAIILDVVRDYRKQRTDGRPDRLPLESSILAYGGRAALAIKEYGEAETILRDAIRVYDATIPNNWQSYNVRCFLAEALIGQEKLDEAENVLVAGYQGIYERRASIPPGNTSRLRVVAEQLKQLAEKRNLPEEVDRWTRELEKLDGESSKKSEDAG